MTKTVLITGSTDGIGKGIALRLAKMGHSIIVHGRRQEKVDRVLQELEALTGRSNFTGYVADFSDVDAVRRMLSALKRDGVAIDILINNAGVFNSAATFNKNGLDMRMMVNYLIPFMMTKALLPLLKKSAVARIINLSSAAQDRVEADVLSGERGVTSRQSYGQSKCALTMWSYDLAEAERDICVIAVNPGSLLNTNMVKEAFGQHWSSVDKGVDIIVELATEQKHLEHSGEYFDNDAGYYNKAHADVYDAERRQWLAAETRELLKHHFSSNATD